MDTATLITIIMAAMAKAPEVWAIIEQARSGAITAEEALAKLAAIPAAASAADTAAAAAAQAEIDAEYAGKTTP